MRMFGFIVTEPIDVTLHRLRVIHLIALWLVYGWLDDLVMQVIGMDATTVSVEVIGMYFTQLLALVAVFLKTVNEMRNSN